MSDDELTEAEVKAFLAALTRLSRKHGIAIGGCGCCGSPYLERCDTHGAYTVSNIPRGPEPWNSMDWDDLEYKHNE